MSDWTDTLNMRRAGEIEGFHDVNERIDRLDDDELPSTADLAPDSDAPQPPALPTSSAIGGHDSRSTKTAAKKTAAKKTAAKKAGSTRTRR